MAEADDSFTRELEESSLHYNADSANDNVNLDDADSNLPTTDEQQQQEQSNNRFVSSVADEEARDAALRAELESIRRVNKLITSVNQHLQNALGNMGVRDSPFPFLSLD